METYLVLKFVHVVAAVLWVGGGLAFTILTILAGRDGRRLLALLDSAAPLGLIALPSSLVTLVSGGTLVWLGAWGFAPWVVVALAGTLASIAVGATVLGPTLGRIAAARAQGDEAGALTLAERLAWPGRIEGAVLVVVVSLMVTKPGWAEMPIVVALAVALFAGVATLNLRSGRAHLA